MANSPNSPQQLQDALTFTGMNVNSLDKSVGATWIQNMFARAGRYETRGGFGTIAQFGTTMNSGREAYPTPYGYGPALGAYLQVTDQDHRQLLSVHKLNAFTGMTDGQNIDSLLAISVFDISTGRRAEHVLRRQSQWTSNLPNVTLQTSDNPQWIQDSNPSVPSFAQLADLTYICIPSRGVFFYRPIDPVLVDQKLQSVPGLTPNGDSAWIETMLPTDGAFVGAGNVYYNPTTFPQPTAMCTYLNRMVYASGRKLFFSDVDRPDNILANSFYNIPTELPITSVVSVKGVILAFTAEETWLYQPSNPDLTGLISGGTVYNLSSSIGCFSPSSLVKMADTVVFMDARGVYSCDGGMSVTKISDAIDPWFSLPDQIQNPFTSYVVSRGGNNLANEQPRAWIDFGDQLARATMAWDSQNQFLYITLQDMALLYSPKNGWSVLLFETMAVEVNGQPQVGIQQRIQNPIILTHGGLTYMVGGPEVENYSDILDSSIYILQMGRGGSLDRSSVTQEDLREPYQFWRTYYNGITGASPNFWVAPPIPLPRGFITSNQTLSSETILVPIYAANKPATALVTGVELKVQFDKVNWKPVMIPGQPTKFDYILPPQRLGSYHGWTDLQLYQGGAPSATGDTFVMHWEGSLVPNTWTAWPNMVLTKDIPQPIMYIMLQRTTAMAGTTVLDANLTIPNNGARMKFAAWEAAKVYVAEQSLSYPQQDLGDNTHAQPVDWALGTKTIGDGKAQYKARGTFSTIQSYGKAEAQQVPNWIYGPFGSMTASDYKDFSAQSKDYVSNDPDILQDVLTPRDRLQIPGATSPTAKTGSHVARWGNTSVMFSGNLLIDDPATDTIATSEGVRGEYFRSMLAGCLNANGEAIKVQKVAILTRMTGGARRTGRARQI